MKTRIALSGLSAIAFALTACGGDGDSGKNAPVNVDDADSGTGGDNSGSGGSATSGTGGKAPAGGAGGGVAGGAGGTAAATGGAGGGSSTGGTAAGDGGSTGSGGSADDAGAGSGGAAAADSGAGGAVNVGDAGNTDGGFVLCLLDCGDRGTCTVTGGQQGCVCDEGYTGAACDSCDSGYREAVVAIGDPFTCTLDEPATTMMQLWLDADHDASFTLNSGNVVTWGSRVPGDSTVFTDGGVSANRPRRLTPTRGSRQWVRFDGVDDRLHRLVDLRSDTYSVYIVANAGANAAEQIFLHGLGETNLTRGLRLSARDTATSLLFRHSMPGGMDETSVPSFDTTSPRVIEAHRASFLNGIGTFVYNGTGYTSAAVTQAAFDERLDIFLGRRGDSTLGALDGDIAEVILFAPAVASADRADVRAYLQAKWNAQ